MRKYELHKELQKLSKKKKNQKKKSTQKKEKNISELLNNYEYE